jgi:selenide, water dikinase
VLIGAATGDDAGVYKISDDLALIQTVDFFTPIVDDPFDFGRIAAANSLSDVYAMGGEPKTAMNIVAYPITKLGLEVLKEILAGGAEKVREAEAVLLGGHSVEDDELKYGLSVTGFVHPQKILANRGLCDGDCLILTKPLGTGIINTAIKGNLAKPGTIKEVTELMATLNKTAAKVMGDFSLSSCTDVTGFGLLGHLAEMIEGSGIRVTLESDAIPILKEAKEFGAMGFVPVGAHKNREYRKTLVHTDDDFDPVLRDILYDPQTSGGLLIGCLEKDAVSLKNRLRSEGVEHAEIIGRVQTNTTAEIVIQ